MEEGCCANCKYLNKDIYRQRKGLVYELRWYVCEIQEIPMAVNVINGKPNDIELTYCGCSAFKEKDKTLFDL